MPIDPTIPLRVRSPDFQGYDTKQAQLKSLLMQQQAAEQALADDKAQREAFAQSGGDMPSYLKNLAAGGNYKAYQSTQKNMADLTESQNKADAMKFKLANDKANTFLNLASSAVDQPSYEAALRTAQGMGVDISKAPPNYDPNFVANFGRQALSQKERIEAAARQQGIDIQNLNQQESARHNRAQEGISVRGQNLTDARARDLNQITKDNKPLTDAQSKAALFGSRMQSANETLNTLSKEGTDTSIPGARSGYGIGAAINVFSPASQQQLEQAKRDFVNATLRRESGAVISDSEFANAEEQYFPQIGDSDAVKKQKMRNREIAMRGVLAEVPEGRREGLVKEIVGPSPSKAPRVGTLEDGYKFRGGDPADPKNWEKM